MKTVRRSQVESRSAVRHAHVFRSSILGRGFTLIDMLIAVGILAVLASVVIPAVQSAGAQTLESTARILAADLRLARSQAIGFNTHYTVRFDFADNSYELLHTGAGSPPPLVNPLGPASTTPGTYMVELDTNGSTTPRPGAAKLAFAELSQSLSPVTEVRFGPTGSTGPDRSDDTIVWLTAGSGTETRAIPLTVSWITGQVWIGLPQMLSENGG